MMRARLQYLENYQALVMAESESGVSQGQTLKEVFLTLRVAAENAK